LFDLEKPELTQNLSVALGFTPTAIELRDQAYDAYYVFDQNSGQLFTARLDQPVPQPYISGVLAFASQKDTVAYVTAQDAAAGKVLVRLKIKNDPALTVKQLSAGTTYLLDMAVYENRLYVAAGATSENRLFLYRDPVGMLKARPKEPLAPIQILKVVGPNHLSFSINKRFVIAENADKFAVYDIKTDRGYAYQSSVPLDAPQAFATWMDGFHLAYVSGGKTVVFDYDGTNLVTLSAASPNYMPLFDPNYRYLYTFDPQNALDRTALLTLEDL
jgi:hypothetical protein